MADLDTEYVIEGLSPWSGLWYFVSRLHGLTRAVELAAVMREVKGHPMRVVPAQQSLRIKVSYG